MTYDDNQVALKDQIRFIVGDTNATDELKTDAEYTAVIARYTNWKRAVAEIAFSIATDLDQRVSSLTAVGDASLGWPERAKTLRLISARYYAEADAEDAAATSGIGQMISVRAPYLTGRGY